MIQAEIKPERSFPWSQLTACIYPTLFAQMVQHLIHGGLMLLYIKFIHAVSKILMETVWAI
ncbi:hypothetical protein HMPREF3214_00198 [Alloscardovia omnicolens]|uniref:Uncharacterized protein n=1 Tax=Alloscardovia omnicolens F0580 TaxID=1321816 RepID=U1RDP3_9BIFI|nr:hypothetical protein HMPREF9244_00166 [Alloscardovia omnicolens F0580]KWZ76003.1 hypothetical protein HMPREF3214_00198 [Alloscardovia omnicolens]